MKKRIQFANAAAARLHGQEGSALVEYAFIFTVFTMMLLGIVDFGRALYAYHFVSNAAREATRWAAVNGSTCSNDGSCNGADGMSNGPATQSAVQSHVTSITPPGIDTSKLVTTATWPGSSTCSGTVNAPGCPVQVQVSYTFTFLTPLVSSTPMTLRSTSEMVIAH